MTKLDLDLHAKSFPSDNTLRKHNFMQATCDTMVLGNKLRHKKIYIACYKGNKKGVGHFVKVLSTLNNLGWVNMQLSDIDASRGASEECALAIHASMNKLKANNDDDAHKLYGQGANSGGGGTIENLYRKLQGLSLTALRRRMNIL